MPAIDFCRALNERPVIVKWLFRLFVGRPAYREFLFMLDVLQQESHMPLWDYGLEDCDYHDDPQSWFWWKRYDDEWNNRE